MRKVKTVSKETSTVELVFGIIGVVVALVVLGLFLFFMKGEKVYEESADFTAGEAHFQFSLPGEEPGYRLFLLTKTHYTDDYHYWLHAQLTTPSGEAYENEITDTEAMVDSNTSSTTRYILFAIPPEEGAYHLTVSLAELSGDITINTIKVEVRER